MAGTWTNQGGTCLGQLFGPVILGVVVQATIDANALLGPVIPGVVIQAVIDP